MNYPAMVFIRPFLFIQKLMQRKATIENVRRYSRWGELLFSTPKGVQVEKIRLGTQVLEWLSPAGSKPDPVILYIHGGFSFPLYNPTRFLAGSLAQMAGIRALLVDFRLAPEHPFPAAVEDCAAAYRWLVSEGGVPPARVFFVGESAGGNLAVATMLSLRDAGQALPAAAALISPVADFEGGGSFYTQNDPMASADFVMRQLDAYRGGASPRDPLLSPLHADLRGLPPLLIQVGSEEILRSGAEALARRAEDAGVSATLEMWPGMWHYWHLFLSMLPPARGAMENIVDFLLSVQGEAPGKQQASAPQAASAAQGA